MNANDTICNCPKFAWLHNREVTGCVKTSMYDEGYWEEKEREERDMYRREEEANRREYGYR